MNVLPPVRVRHQDTHTNPAPPEQVFPLMCPVREVEWAGGWEPLDVFTSTGVAEADCVFTTAEAGGRKAVWVVTRYEPENFRIDLIKVIPDLVVTKVEIALTAGPDDTTVSHVAYTLTALSAEGRELVEGFSDAVWRRFISTWEAEANHYLSFGGSLDETTVRYE